VRLFLVRHAHSDPGDPDSLRPLSPRGLEQARELGERLAPGASADDVLAAIDGAGGTVVVVGHQPDCSEIAAALGAGDLDFPTAGMAEIELP